ncbi:MAG: DUF4091 domain-containing protein [Clostridia bacterium]|nr:DUF4091 domain-containing protein [Clostridia bacterium]
MRKWLKSLLAGAMAVGMIISTACVGNKGDQPGNSSTPDTPPVIKSEAVELKVAYTEDKILQNYYDGTTAKANLGDKFETYLMEDFHIETFRNEYESRTIIIRPESDVASYDVVASDFTCGEYVIPASLFDLRHQYYHEVTKVMSDETEMQPGMYPDAMLPLSVAKEYELNSIKGGDNQGVLVTIEIPSNQPAGIYKGTFNVLTDGRSNKLNATIEVLDYTLPEKVTAKSCMPVSSKYLGYLEMEETQEMYQKVSDILNDFRLATEWLYGLYPESNKESVFRELAYLDAELMHEATLDPTVASYGMRTNGRYQNVVDPATGKVVNVAVLNTDTFRYYTETYVKYAIDHEVDIFKKAYVYMGSIIDEPEAWGNLFRVDYVCNQFNNALIETAEYARSYAESVGSTWDGFEDFINSILNLEHVVTTYIDSHGGFELIDAYCTEPQYFHSSAVIDDYRQHREDGGNYWVYTCCNPNTPYPTIHIDDNGVSGRVMWWQMREYDISGYLGWETIGTWDGYPDYSHSKPLHGIDQYYDVMRNNTDVGDAYYFYPGKIFGLDAPVPCLRLWYMRDGSEDYEAITDLDERLYPALSEAYGKTLDSSGLLNEVYAELYSIVKVYSNSHELAYAKEAINSLLVWAEDGIAISDYKVNSNGGVTAKVYAPEGSQIKVNGKLLSGTACGNGMVYEVNENTAKVTFEINGRTLTVGAESTSIAEIDPSRVGFEVEVNGNLESYDKVTVTKQEYKNTGVQTLNMTLTSEIKTMLYAIDKNDLNANTKSIIFYMYYDGAEKIKATINVYGKNMRMLDTVYINPGYNVIRVDRLNDLAWSKIGNANCIIFEFNIPESVSSYTLDIEKIIKLS